MAPGNTGSKHACPLKAQCGYAGPFTYGSICKHVGEAHAAWTWSEPGNVWLRDKIAVACICGSLVRQYTKPKSGVYSTQAHLCLFKAKTVFNAARKLKHVIVGETKYSLPPWLAAHYLGYAASHDKGLPVFPCVDPDAPVPLQQNVNDAEDVFADVEADAAEAPGAGGGGGGEAAANGGGNADGATTATETDDEDEEVEEGEQEHYVNAEDVEAARKEGWHVYRELLQEVVKDPGPNNNAITPLLDVLQAPPPRPPAPPAPNNVAAIAAAERQQLEQASALAGGGKCSQASSRLLSSGTWPVTQSNSGMLQAALAPPLPAIQLAVPIKGANVGEPIFDMIEFDVARVRAYVDDMDSTKAGGPNCRGVRDFKEWASQPANMLLLTQFVNIVANGALTHPAMKAALLARRGVALRKKNSVEPRLIGIADVGFRVVAGLLNRFFTPQFTKLMPHNFAIRKGGREMLAMRVMHSAKVMSKITITGDIKKAYDHMRRAAVHAGLSGEGLEQLLRYYEWLSEAPTVTTFTREDGTRVTVSAAEGAPQGDPLSGALFGLGLEPYLEQTRQQHANTDVDIVTFVDDFYMTGEASAAIAAYQSFENGLQAATLLTLQASKSVAYVHTLEQAQQVAAALPGVRVVYDGLVVVGIPIGNDAFVETNVRDKCSEALRLLDRITAATRLKNGKGMTTQAAVGMIANCVLTRVSHFAQVLPVNVIKEAITEVQERVVSTLRDIAHVGPATSATQQLLQRRIFLPMRDGGMGFHDIVGTADLALTATAARVVPTMRTLYPEMVIPAAAHEGVSLAFLPHHDAALSRMEASGGLPPAVLTSLSRMALATAAPRNHMLSSMTKHWSKVKVDKIIADAKLLNDPTLTATQLSSTSWRAAVAPLYVPSNRIPNDAYEATIQVYLGGTTNTHQQPACTLCNRPMQSEEQHAPTCAKGGKRFAYSGHNRVVHAIKAVVVKYGGTVILEPRLLDYHVELGGLHLGVDEEEGLINYRSDMRITGNNGCRTFVDIGLTAPDAVSNVVSAAKRAGAAAEKYEKVKDEKMKKYFKDISKNYPLIVERYGRIGEKGMAAIGAIADSLSGDGEGAVRTRGRIMGDILVAISVGLWKAVGGQVAGHRRYIDGKVSQLPLVLLQQAAAWAQQHPDTDSEAEAE